MAWYLRKSVSAGPVRFALSKNGVGASVGISGFRIRIRSDGSSYVRVGRKDFDLSDGNSKRGGSRQKISSQYLEPPPTQRFDVISTRKLTSPDRMELIERLNKSYMDFRIDYFIFVVSLVIYGAAWLSDSQFVMIMSIGFGVLLIVAASIFESSRRTVKIYYDFEDADTSSFTKLVSALNHLAKCKRLWAYVDSRDLRSVYESKINAGASSLVNRESAVVGTGKPPWVETNITIPVLKARGVTAYFMPDCILVYDSTGVGCVEHESLSFSANAERFIEDGPVPSDSHVVDTTWRYANKSGGPDRRFNSNKEIPVCLYGKLDLSTSAGLLCHLQTSKKDAPKSFSRQYSAYIQAINARRETVSRQEK